MLYHIIGYVWLCDVWISSAKPRGANSCTTTRATHRDHSRGEQETTKTKPNKKRAWVRQNKPVPSRKTNISHLGKRKTIFKKCLYRGYVSSQESISKRFQEISKKNQSHSSGWKKAIIIHEGMMKFPSVQPGTEDWFHPRRFHLKMSSKWGMFQRCLVYTN